MKHKITSFFPKFFSSDEDFQLYLNKEASDEWVLVSVNSLVGGSYYKMIWRERLLNEKENG